MGNMIPRTISDETDPTLSDDLEVAGYNVDDVASIRGPNDLQALSFTYVASAVNECHITNAATGNSVKYGASGDDADVGINIESKGDGDVTFGSGNNPNGFRYEGSTGDIALGGTPSGDFTVLRDTAGAPVEIGVDNGGTTGAGTTARFAMKINETLKAYLEFRQDGTGELALDNLTGSPLLLNETGGGKVHIGTPQTARQFTVNSGGDNVVALLQSTDAGALLQFNDGVVNSYCGLSTNSDFVIANGSAVSVMRVSSDEGLHMLDAGVAPAAISGFSCFYSLLGEAYLQDDSGNATLQTSHPTDGPDEIYRDAESGRLGHEFIIKQVRSYANQRGTKAWGRDGEVLNGVVVWENPHKTLGKAVIAESFDEYNTRRGLTEGDPGFLTPIDCDEQIAEENDAVTQYAQDVRAQKTIPRSLRTPIERPADPRKRPAFLA